MVRTHHTDSSPQLPPARRLRNRRERLTDLAAERAKPKERPYKLTDGNGLYLLITPTGTKLWHWRYGLAGKEKVMALGPYPLVSLAEAREKRDDQRRKLLSGADPMQERKAAKIAAKSAALNSFRSAAQAWWDSWKVGRSQRHAEQVWRRLEADVFPVIGGRSAGAIEPPEIVDMVKKIAKRGALDIAKRALQTTGQVFRHAVAHGVARRNPVADIRPSDLLGTRKKENYSRVDTKDLPDRPTDRG